MKLSLNHDHKCEEASPLSHQFYIPCGRPAVTRVHFKHSGEGPYWMCLMCADHNVSNRNASYYEPEDAESV